MAVPCQHIFTRIPEPQLRPLLVLHALDFRIFDLLQVKLCHLDGGFADWQELVNQLDYFEVTLNFVLN